MTQMLSNLCWRPLCPLLWCSLPAASWHPSMRCQLLCCPCLPRHQASEKFRFNFDWDSKEDTSRDLNPLYNNLHGEVGGRGVKRVGESVYVAGGGGEGGLYNNLHGEGRPRPSLQYPLLTHIHTPAPSTTSLILLLQRPTCCLAAACVPASTARCRSSRRPPLRMSPSTGCGWRRGSVRRRR
jgi:hypothetical protein